MTDPPQPSNSAPEPAAPPSPMTGWNWAAGVPVAVAIGFLPVSLLVLPLLLIALLFLRNHRPAWSVALPTLLIGALVTYGFAVLLTEPGVGRDDVRVAMVITLAQHVPMPMGIGLLVSGPMVASSLALGLQRRPDGWNWAAGCIAVLSVLVMWHALLAAAEVLHVVGLLESPLVVSFDLIDEAESSGALIFACSMAVAAVCTAAAVALLVARRPRRWIVALALLGGVLAGGSLSWFAQHRWDALADADRRAFEEGQDIYEGHLRDGSGLSAEDRARIDERLSERYRPNPLPSGIRWLAWCHAAAMALVAALALRLRYRDGPTPPVRSQP